MSTESNIVHVSRCGGIPMYPNESIINGMKDTLNEERFEIYKYRVEKVWGNWESNLRGMNNSNFCDTFINA